MLEDQLQGEIFEEEILGVAECGVGQSDAAFQLYHGAGILGDERVQRFESGPGAEDS